MPIPIPPHQVGAFFGNRLANLQLDVFVDIQCPFSAKAWPMVEQIMAHYGPDRIGVSVKMMVLANHRQSFDITRALTALAGDDDAIYFKFVSYLYEHQESYFNGPFSDKTHADLLAHCADLAHGFDGRDRVEFAREMESDETYANTKHPFRAAALAGVWSTPTFYMNGSELTNLGSASTLDDWKAIIDPLLEK